MRTVRDARGVMWICLEMPEVPNEHVVAAAAIGPSTVAVECNSGAERVLALLQPGWDDDLDDATLAGTILGMLA